MTNKNISKMGMVGTGAMGTGIAQIFAQADIDVLLFDAREGAAEAAKSSLSKVFDRLVEKEKISNEAAKQALAHLYVIKNLEDLAPCDLIIEAIVENLEIKHNLLQQLESIIRTDAIIATNTSSLSVSAIAAGLKNPERVAGFHFFNPVPLMKVVEVIAGIKTDPLINDTLLNLAKKIGHTGVRTQDTPGFIVNHAGRAYGTEALRILGEGVAPIGDIDRVLRESTGFRMGPFELLDLTALDVSHPVMESIYNQYYQEPRYRPHPLTRQMLSAGLLGRKVGEGFYRYEKGVMLNPAPPQPIPEVKNIPPIWLGVEDKQDRSQLIELIKKLGGTLETSEKPSDEALCLLAPFGEDATSAAQRFNTDPKRTVCIDLMGTIDKHRTLMLTPITEITMRDAAHALFAKGGINVTVIHDSTGFIVQRVLASIVNLACDIAQQQIANTNDIDLAVKLGLGYPYGPLEWGDRLGAKRILTILERMTATTGDPRYRPSPWLRRRATLGISLRLEETSINH